jgi:hypothetical protein
MNKTIIILALILFGQFTVLSQIDSISTIKLQRINDYGTPVEKLINPFKSVSIVTNSGKKIKLDSVRFIGDSMIIATNDTVLVSDIVRVNAKRQSVPRIILGTLTGLVGTITFVGGISYPTRTGEGLDRPIEVDYSTQIFFMSTGIGIITTGIFILNSKTHFDTRNKWIIKSGYFKYNHNRYNLTKVNNVDNYN